MATTFLTSSRRPEQRLDLPMVWEFQEFSDDLQTTYAVLHALTIVGEAAKNIPTEVLQRHPEIPWREVTGMRDNIAHGYFGLDLRVVWDTVREDLPKLM